MHLRHHSEITFSLTQRGYFRKAISHIMSGPTCCPSLSIRTKRKINCFLKNREMLLCDTTRMPQFRQHKKPCTHSRSAGIFRTSVLKRRRLKHPTCLLQRRGIRWTLMPVRFPQIKSTLRKLLIDQRRKEYFAAVDSLGAQGKKTSLLTDSNEPNLSGFHVTAQNKSQFSLVPL